MRQASPRQLTLEEFLDWYPDRYRRYELRHGAMSTDDLNQNCLYFLLRSRDQVPA
ncbi:MAG: hypothetical protein HC921_09440 [Synechococcaceae cyanobacterium SM2_3_1]|nr:hypothetical protein [Synechococcaceae cyanobacterium SM2_3_1]